MILIKTQIPYPLTVLLAEDAVNPSMEAFRQRPCCRNFIKKHGQWILRGYKFHVEHILNKV